MKSIFILMPASLHARPSAVLAKNARAYQSDVILKVGDKTCDGKNPVAILALGILQHTQIELLVSGPDEEIAINELSRFIQQLN